MDTLELQDWKDIVNLLQEAVDMIGFDAEAYDEVGYLIDEALEKSVAIVRAES